MATNETTTGTPKKDSLKWKEGLKPKLRCIC